MFDSWRERRAEVTELNLIPIMNLMMTLIPFLLLGAAFYHIGVIPTSLPSHTPEGTGEPEKTEIVTLNLEVGLDGIRLSASASGLTEETLAGLGVELPKKDGRYDLEALQARIIDIKSQYPKSDTVIVLPAEEVTYQNLVDVLDTTRERIIPVEGKDPRHEPLFPVTVFSRLLTEAPDAAEEDSP